MTIFAPSPTLPEKSLSVRIEVEKCPTFRFQCKYFYAARGKQIQFPLRPPGRILATTHPQQVRRLHDTYETCARSAWPVSTAELGSPVSVLQLQWVRSGGLRKAGRRSPRSLHSWSKGGEENKELKMS